MIPESRNVDCGLISDSNLQQQCNGNSQQDGNNATLSVSKYQGEHLDGKRLSANDSDSGRGQTTPESSASSDTEEANQVSTNL